MKREKRIIVATAFLLVILIVIINNRINRPLAYDPKSTENYTVSFARPKQSSYEIENENREFQVAESENIRLVYNPALHEIGVENKATGYIWRSAFKNSTFRQLCNVTLINNESDNTLVINDVEQQCDIKARGNKNGVSLELYFPVQGVGFRLEIWLEKGRLWALIPIDSVTEGDVFSILSISMLPYFGSCESGEDGYIMFPDGSGALYDFSQSVVAVSPITADVYSEHVTDADSFLENRESGVHPARIPAYGIRRGNDSFIAYIADGAASSSITLEPAGYVSEINRIYGKSVYRKVTEVVSEAGISSFRSDGRLGAGDFSVCYRFLNGEKSDYSGMAAAVRELLIEYGMINKANPAHGIKLDIIMGAESSTMIGNVYKTVTNVSQAEKIISSVKTPSDGMSVVLVGWQKQGYGIYPDTGKPAAETGDLKKLTVPENVDLFLDYNAVLADKGRKGAILRRDGIRDSKGITVLGKDSQMYIINANTQLKMFEKILPGLSFGKKYGLSVSGAGSILYDDYNKKCGMTREQTKNSLSALMDKAGKSGRVIINEPNDYSLKYADFVSGLYQNSSGYHILGESVPFFQMVISGLIPYSLDIAGNLSPDFKITRLRWAEYGAVPYFTVSYDGSSKLYETKADVFFSVNFDDHKELINKTAVEFEELNKTLGGSRLCGHKKISGNVYCSEFENGASVITNYGDTAVTVNGVSVPPMDYAVVKGDRDV